MDKCHFYARFISESGLCTQTACFPIPQALHVFFHPEIGDGVTGVNNEARRHQVTGGGEHGGESRSMVRVYELPRSWPPLYVNNTRAAFPHPDPGVHVLKVRQSTAVQPPLTAGRSRVKSLGWAVASFGFNVNPCRC